MKKQFSRILSAFLALALVFTLSACGAKKETSSEVEGGEILDFGEEHDILYTYMVLKIFVPIISPLSIIIFSTILNIIIRVIITSNLFAVLIPRTVFTEF